MRLFFVSFIVSFACCCLLLETTAAEPRLSASGTISAVARVEYPTGMTPVRAMAATLASSSLSPHPPGKADTESIVPLQYRYLIHLPGAGDVSISVTRRDTIEQLYYSPTLAISSPGVSPGPSEQTLFFDLATDPDATGIIVTVAYLGN